MTNRTHPEAAASLECTQCATGLRNRFYRGKQMKAEEFEAEQTYFIRRRRLVNRGVLGWGVVHGLALDGPRPSNAAHDYSAQPASAPPTIKIGPGFALDRHGREIVLPQPALLGIDNAFALLRDASGCTLQKIDALAPGRYLLSIHYAERHLGDANLPQSCGCAKPEKRYVCETVLFSLEALAGDCPCAEGGCERECRCGADGCCLAGRGPHACLCQWATEAPVADEPAQLCEWQGWRLDPGDGVALACITLARSDDRCAPLAFTSIDDDCSPRRLVKSNDLLYDLFRGCDLTKIESITWAAWHRKAEPVPWLEFVKFMNALAEPVPSAKDVVTGLQIGFSGPVETRTLTPDCFELRFIVASEDSGWRSVRSVPILRIDVEAPRSTDPKDSTRSAALCVDPDWISEMRTRPSVFKHEGATVEIEVHGDYILDCHGQAVDANARGFALARTSGAAGGTSGMSGNGSPGGSFRSVFRIERYAPAA